MEAIFRWLQEVVFQYLQKRLYPDYVKQVEQLAKDKAAFDLRVAEHERQAVQRDAAIAQREQAIAAREVQIAADQQRVNESQSEVSKSLEEVEAIRKRLKDAKGLDEIVTG